MSFSLPNIYSKNINHKVVRGIGNDTARRHQGPVPNAERLLDDRSYDGTHESDDRHDQCYDRLVADLQRS